MEKPIPFGSRYIMKPGMTYREVCVGMRLDESEIEAGILALELLNGPETQRVPFTNPTTTDNATNFCDEQ